MPLPIPFRMPRPVRITGRSSTITNSFVNGIIPVFTPSDDEVREALGILGMSTEDVRCAYCGDHATEWDHLRPLVRMQRPTGYVSEIANLVPACGKCNQSKSGADWRAWMTGGARQSPATRRTPGLQARVRRLETFERWRAPRRIDFESVVGRDTWRQHWDNHARLLGVMRECEEVATGIRDRIRQSVGA